MVSNCRYYGPALDPILPPLLPEPDVDGVGIVVPIPVSVVIFTPDVEFPEVALDPVVPIDEVFCALMLDVRPLVVTKIVKSTANSPTNFNLLFIVNLHDNNIFKDDIITRCSISFCD